MTTMTADDLMPISDAARAAKTSRRQFYRFLADGTIRARKLGGRTFVERAEIARFLTSLPAYQAHR